MNISRILRNKWENSQTPDEHCKNADRYIEHLNSLLSAEYQLAIGESPFKCINVECIFFGKPVQRGHCKCYAEHLLRHRDEVKESLEF